MDSGESSTSIEKNNVYLIGSGSDRRIASSIMTL